MNLIRQNEKGMALSGVKFKNALEGSQEYKAAVAEADKLKVKQKLAFRIKTKEGSFIFIRAKEGESLRLFDTDSLSDKGAYGATTMDELNKIDSKATNQAVGELVHQSLLMHGVNVAEANVKYTGSTKLQEDAVHHVIDIFDAEFNPKMNQNDVVIAPPHEAASLFKGDPVISLFSQEIKAGKDAILQQYSKFDEGAFLNDTQGQKPYFDEQLLNDNLQQTGQQAGTQKGGFYKDAATGENFYVKYPENVELAKNEFIAASIYRELGVPFPLTKLVGDSKGNIIGVASKIVPGSKMITPDEFIKLPEAARNKFAENALIDMYLGNWDVVGNFPNYNLLLTPDGTVV